MTKDAFKDRERAAEEGFFRKSDAQLLDKMREHAKLKELSTALAEMLKVQDPELLRRSMDLGITLETGPAFLLAPLVQVAWAEGEVTEPERAAIRRIAARRGLEGGSPAHMQLLAWLETRPPQAVFETSLEVIKAALALLPAEERSERVAKIVQDCREVSEASGGLAKALGLGSGVSAEERSVLDVVTAVLQG